MIAPTSDPSRTTVAELLPHTGTARLLTDIVRHGPGFIEARGRVPTTHPLVTAGRAPCFLGLELGAQAAAALEALLRKTADGSAHARIGYLARIREAEFLRPDFPAGSTLAVSAHLEGEAGPLAIYQVRVSTDGVDLLHAILSTHRGAPIV